ncbi:MAG: tRNA (guanosine(37)-N1)-methyltransferase TrmD [Pseudobdellovibrio sp.]
MKKISFKIITLFPELIHSYLKDAILSKAIANKIINIEITDLRTFSDTKYKSVDDTVFGGGDGMLFKFGPLSKALNNLNILKKQNPGKKIVYLSPQGKPWKSEIAKSWAQSEEIILICGRYAGIDQRFIHHYVDEEISIGDYILSGGELAALVVIESVSRFIPGVLGDMLSAQNDSFEEGLLEAPQFTKPQIENVSNLDLAVPAVLYSGNHQLIAEWKASVAILITLKKRPDLLANKKNISWESLKDFYKNMKTEDKTILDLLDLEFET